MVVLITCVIVASAALVGQPQFRVRVDLVQIEVRVSRNGEAVTDLKKEDFKLWVDGRPQELAVFQFAQTPKSSRPAAAEGADRTLPSQAGSPQDRVARVDEVATEPQWTWVYLAPEASNAREFSRAADGIRRFINEQLRPGFLVSLGGLPFTNSRKLLLEALDRMAQGPYGAGLDHPPGVRSTLLHADDLEFEREIAKALNEETSLIASLVGYEREPLFQAGARSRISQVPAMSVEKVDRQIMFFGQLALFRYLDLIEKLAFYPGKKVVVLFRSGLRLDAANHPLVDRLAAAALRHRVSFYTADPRGLDTIPPVEDRRYALAWRSGRERPPNILERQNRDFESREGLIVLARETGGRAVADTNDMGAVLDVMLDDTSDYYVLGYYPTDLADGGRFRKIRISVSRPGVKVVAPKGYYEDEPFARQSRSERVASLHRALQREDSDDFTLATRLSLFSGDDRQPVLWFSLGVRLDKLATNGSRKNPELQASVLARVTDAVSQKLPVYHEHPLKYRIPHDQWEKGFRDETVFMTYNSRIPISPGVYRWKSVLRDEYSGELGRFQANVVIPDFRRPSTPSTLLLTRQVTPLQAPGSDKSPGTAPGFASQLLQANGLSYALQPAYVFRQGETIYLLYELYNPTAEDLDAASRGMQIGLLRNGEAIREVDASGRPHIDRQNQVIRFSAEIQTLRLVPGQYTVLAFLPNHENRQVPHLQEEFSILPRLDERSSASEPTER